MKLSIIIPVYQVENYIHPCLASVYRQRLNDSDFEVILINDGTLDGSFNRITDIISAHHNITIIEQENHGLSAARNIGMNRAIGTYIMFLDSDDVLVDNSLTPMLQDLEKHQPDLLVADFIKCEDHEVCKKSPIPQTDYHSNIHTGSELFVKELNPRESYVWRTLYRRAFLNENHLHFIDGIYFEDVPFTTECYLKAGKCLKAHHVFYVYRQRPGAIVSTINKRKVMDFHQGIAKLWEFHKTMRLTREEHQKLIYTIFTTFSIEMWYITHHQHLFAERKAIIHDLKTTVPDLCFSHGIKQRVVSFLYRHMPYVYLRLRALANRRFYP